MSFKELIERRVGFIYSEDGVYEPHKISFTVEVGERVEIGDIVCIKHPSKDIPVFYQVTEVPLKRKGGSYEEDLIRVGKLLKDESRNYPRAAAVQLGYVEDVDSLMSGEFNGELMMLIEHIEPLSDVYRPKDVVIRSLLKSGGVSIELGEVYPNWKYCLELDVRRLLRQGLLVIGGVGTGKTTTMLSILIKVIKRIKEEGGRPHVLIVDKDGEYGVDELIRLVGERNYVEIDTSRVLKYEFIDKEEFIDRLLDELGISDRRRKEARLVMEAVRKCDKEVLILSPDFIKNELLKGIYDLELRRLVDGWSKRFKRLEDPKVVVNQLKEKEVVHVNLSKVYNLDMACLGLAEALREIYMEALEDPNFGCIIVIDEAHLFAPERGGISLLNDAIENKLRSTLHLIATTGARNGVTLFLATQRPSLLSKTLVTQMGQNIIAHRVEDVDLHRLKEMIGDIAERVRVLPKGWALVKAAASRIKEPLIVRIKPEALPKSAGRTAYERFINQSTRYVNRGEEIEVLTDYTPLKEMGV